MGTGGGFFDAHIVVKGKGQGLPLGNGTVGDWMLGHDATLPLETHAAEAIRSNLVKPVQDFRLPQLAFAVMPCTLSNSARKNICPLTNSEQL